MYSYSTFCSPNVNGLSLFELVFVKKPRTLLDLETDPNTIKVSSSCKEYYEMLNKMLQYVQKLLFDFKWRKSCNAE